MSKNTAYGNWALAQLEKVCECKYYALADTSEGWPQLLVVRGKAPIWTEALIAAVRTDDPNVAQRFLDEKSGLAEQCLQVAECAAQRGRLNMWAVCRARAALECARAARILRVRRDRAAVAKDELFRHAYSAALRFSGSDDRSQAKQSSPDVQTYETSSELVAALRDALHGMCHCHSWHVAVAMTCDLIRQMAEIS